MGASFLLRVPSPKGLVGYTTQKAHHARRSQSRFLLLLQAVIPPWPFPARADSRLKL